MLEPGERVKGDGGTGADRVCWGQTRWVAGDNRRTAACGNEAMQTYVYKLPSKHLRHVKYAR